MTHLGITCLLLKYRGPELIDFNRRLNVLKLLGGLMQQAIEVRLQGQLRASSQLLRTIHQATCWAVFCVNRCLSSAR
ncbi:hypothetical protein D3C75_948380 [compost metagenome]